MYDNVILFPYFISPFKKKDGTEKKRKDRTKGAYNLSHLIHIKRVAAKRKLFLDSTNQIFLVKNFPLASLYISNYLSMF